MSLSTMLTKSLVVLTLPVLIAGCALDVGKVIAEARKPSVGFAIPAAWSCSEDKVTVPMADKLDRCTKCLNITTEAQRVTLGKVEELVAPRRAILICSTQALVQP